MSQKLITTGTYLASNGSMCPCTLSYSSYTNKYFWDIYGHNAHYPTVGDAIASMSFFVPDACDDDLGYYSECSEGTLHGPNEECNCPDSSMMFDESL